MLIALVYRSGGKYTAAHVERLRQQIVEPGGAVDEYMVLTDDPTIFGARPFLHDWPGWWSKMELMRPDINGNVLYFDLDVTICGSLEGLLAQRCLTVLRGFKPANADGFNSSVMMLTPQARRQAWDVFSQDPAYYMHRFRRGGDQDFLRYVWGPTVPRWQDVLPGDIVSYKRQCKKGIPLDTRVIVYHGDPKPWDIGQ